MESIWETLENNRRKILVATETLIRLQDATNMLFFVCGFVCLLANSFEWSFDFVSLDLAVYNFAQTACKYTPR